MSKKTTEQLIKQYVRDEICALNAYYVPPADGMIKMDAMENPYVWSDEIHQAWLQKIQLAEINRYPDSNSDKVRKELRKVMQISNDSGLVFGNGSDELIQMIAMVMAGQGRTILAPSPSFVMYEMASKFTGSQFVGVPLKEDDFQLNVPAMLTAIEGYQPAVIFLAYPNNPTGNLFKRSDIEQILHVAPGLVVIDEAYHVFAGDSYLPNVRDYPNLIIMRTLSKLGLAGIRLGFMVGPTALMQQLEKVRMPYNINVLTQISAVFALQNMPFFLDKAQQIIQQRTKLEQQLAKIPLVEKVYASAANMVLFKVSASANDIDNKLKQQKILIKNLHQENMPLANHMRVTVSTPEENQLFLQALNNCQ